MIDPRENLDFIPDKVARMKYANMNITLSAYGILYNGEKHEKVENETINMLDYAYSKGLLKVVDLRARKFFEKYWLPLRLSYDFDTGNEEILLKSKKLLELNKNHTTKGTGLIRGGFMTPSGINIYPEIPKTPQLFSEMDNKDFKFDIQLYSIIAKINRALAVCGEFNLVPTFLDDTIIDIFSTKMKVVRNNNEANVKQEFKNINSFELQNVQHLLLKISELIIPDEALKNIPIKELIIARNNTFDQLLKLRRNLVQNINFLAKHQFDKSFNQEVNTFLKKKLEPQLKEYSSNFATIFHKMLNLSSTFTFTALGTVAGLSQSLSPLEIAFLSGITATVGNTISDLPGLLRKKKDKDIINTYSYFLNFNEGNKS